MSWQQFHLCKTCKSGYRVRDRKALKYILDKVDIRNETNDTRMKHIQILEIQFGTFGQLKLLSLGLATSGFSICCHLFQRLCDQFC